MSINLEKASIILELLSFFLVTIDLLGRKRIEVLQNRFEKLLSVIKSIDLKASYTFLTADESEDNLGCLSGCFLFFPILFVILMGSLAAWVYILSFILSFLRSFSGELFACLVLILAVKLAAITSQYLFTFFLFLVRKAGYFLVFLLEIIVDGIFTIILSLFNRLKLEGVMLIVGALLFLFSKILAYINANQ